MSDTGMTDDLRRGLEGLSKQLQEVLSRHKATDTRIAQIEKRLEKVESQRPMPLWAWFKAHWSIIAVLSIPVPSMLFAMVFGVWTMKKDGVLNWVRLELHAAAQNDSVLFQPQGLSFIREPDTGNRVVTYILVARRNPAWVSCVYLTTIPEFMDELGRSLVGPFRPKGRQFTGELTRTELELRVPQGLQPGRVTVVLNIAYDCAGERLTHRTYPVAFELKDRRDTQ